MTPREERLLSALILLSAAVPFGWIVANQPFNDVFIARSLANVQMSAN